MHKAHILVVEDDKPVRSLIATTLEIQDYSFATAETGKQGLMAAATQPPDVIVLDLGLPDMDGVEVIGRIREWSQVPIIVVSARSELKEKIEALDAGADDYLTKPFSVEELLARLRVALRRAWHDQTPSTGSWFENGPLKIDYMAGIAFMDGQELHLTQIEYKLLCLLAQHVGKVLTHRFLLEQVWGSYPENDTSSLRVFMAGLRKKLKWEASPQGLIQTHVGVGYRMLRVEDAEQNQPEEKSVAEAH